MSVLFNVVYIYMEDKITFRRLKMFLSFCSDIWFRYNYFKAMFRYFQYAAMLALPKLPYKCSKEFS